MGTARSMPDKIEGHLEVGTNGDGEVVINIPPLKKRREQHRMNCAYRGNLEELCNCGIEYEHIIFSPRQARGLARLLNKKSNDAESEAHAIASVRGIMIAEVEGGLLDKILKTPVEGTLEISSAEARAIIDSQALPFCKGGYEIQSGLLTNGECVMLGRTLKIGAAEL